MSQSAPGREHAIEQGKDFLPYSTRVPHVFHLLSLHPIRQWQYGVKPNSAGATMTFILLLTTDDSPQDKKNRTHFCIRHTTISFFFCLPSYYSGGDCPLSCSSFLNGIRYSRRLSFCDSSSRSAMNATKSPSSRCARSSRYTYSRRGTGSHSNMRIGNLRRNHSNSLNASSISFDSANASPPSVSAALCCTFFCTSASPVTNPFAIKNLPFNKTLQTSSS